RLHTRRFPGCHWITKTRKMGDMLSDRNTRRGACETSQTRHRSCDKTAHLPTRRVIDFAGNFHRLSASVGAVVGWGACDSCPSHGAKCAYAVFLAYRRRSMRLLALLLLAGCAHISPAPARATDDPAFTPPVVIRLPGLREDRPTPDVLLPG